MNRKIWKHRLSAGLEACLPTVYGLGPLSLGIHFAFQYGIYLRTIILEIPVFISATLCDNHGRLHFPGISSTSVRRAFPVLFSRKVNCVTVVFFGLVLLSDRSARVLKS